MFSAASGNWRVRIIQYPNMRVKSNCQIVSNALAFFHPSHELLQCQAL